MCHVLVYPCVLDLPVDISADDLKYALQGIPDLGVLSVNSTRDCKGYLWEINWLTIPGNQPLLQVKHHHFLNSFIKLDMNPEYHYKLCFISSYTTIICL